MYPLDSQISLQACRSLFKEAVGTGHWETGNTVVDPGCWKKAREIWEGPTEVIGYDSLGISSNAEEQPDIRISE